MTKKPHLAGAVLSCEPVFGWWYFGRGGTRGIFGPFARRDEARADRRARLKTIPHQRYHAPFCEPLRAKASVRLENGSPVWRRASFEVSQAAFEPIRTILKETVGG